MTETPTNQPHGPRALRTAGLTPPLDYRLTVDPANGMNSTCVPDVGDERDPEREVMWANLSRFLHRRNEE
jgi:hypothetical protein